MKIGIKNEYAKDFITREAGERLRNQISDQINNGEEVVLDFKGLVVASTSFFDEGIAKLETENSIKNAVQKLRFLNLHPRDQELLELLCRKRGMKIHL